MKPTLILKGESNMTDIKSLLDDVIEQEIQTLESLDSGSDEKSAAIRDLATLHKLRIEEIKAETEAVEKSKRREMDSEQRKAENALKEKQAEKQADGADADREIKEKQIDAEADRQKAELALKERELNGKDADRTREEDLQKRQAKDLMIDRCVRIGVAMGELVLPLVFYGIWMNRGFKFEETGSFTSTTFKNLLNRFRPTK